METFSALLAFCVRNPQFTGDFPAQRPVTWSLDVSFDLCLNKRLSKQLRHQWFEMLSSSLRRHCNARKEMQRKTTPECSVLDCTNITYMNIIWWAFPWMKTTDFLSHESCKYAKHSLLMNPIMSNACMFYHRVIYHTYLFKLKEAYRKFVLGLFLWHFSDDLFTLQIYKFSIILNKFSIAEPPAVSDSWRCHDMVTLSALLALCEVTSGFPPQYCKALMFYLLSASTNCWTVASNLRSHEAHVMSLLYHIAVKS